MPVVAYAQGEYEEDDVQLVNEFEDTTKRVTIRHDTAVREDTRRVTLSERFWDNWHWFWRKATRLRCSCDRGFTQACFRERYALAWGICLINIISMILYAIAAGTIEWTVVTLNPDGEFIVTGEIKIGLFQAFNRTDYGLSDVRRDYTYLENYGDEVPRWKFIFVFVLIMIGIGFNILAISFAALNSYQLVTTLWKGPLAIYITNLIATVVGFIAVAVYTDLYIWDLQDGQVLLTRELLVRGYQTSSALGWSYILLVIGAALPGISLICAWRILSIFPNLAGPASLFHKTVVDKRDKIVDGKKITTINRLTTTEMQKEAQMKKSPSAELSETEVIY